MATSESSSKATARKTSRRSTSSSEGRRVRPSPSQDCAPVFQTLEEALLSPLSAWPPSLVPDGSVGKTFPVSCQPTEAGLLLPSSGVFKNSGIASPGACWTLSTSEWTAFPEQSPSDAGVCSLSDMLQETHDVPQLFFLSPKSAAGMLRRAANRGKVIPEPLRTALTQVSQRSAAPSPTEPTWAEDSTDKTS